MNSGYMYILKCSNDTYYVGSTKYLIKRIEKHQKGKGANYTSKHLPVELVYFESYNRIDLAFKREHQVKKWSQKKKKALIEGKLSALHDLGKKRF